MAPRKHKSRKEPDSAADYFKLYSRFNPKCLDKKCNEECEEEELRPRCFIAFPDCQKEKKKTLIAALKN
jgi:formamidopyrimidine-DNA glycosylase